MIRGKLKFIKNSILIAEMTKDKVSSLIVEIDKELEKK